MGITIITGVCTEHVRESVKEGAKVVLINILENKGKELLETEENTIFAKQM